MADLGGILDATGSKGREFEPLPPGDYPAVITASERKTSKSNSENSFIEVQVLIEKPDGSTRKVIDRVNLFNTNPTTVQMAKKQLEEMVLATAPGRSGNPNPNAIQNTEQLHNIPFMAKVGVKKGDDKYGPSNEIVKYMPIDHSNNTYSQPTNQPTQAQSVKPAWES